MIREIPIWVLFHLLRASLLVHVAAHHVLAGTIFDCYENRNDAEDAPPAQRKELSATLRTTFGFAV